MKNKKILYLYTGNHLVHRKFAESIGAEITKMSWKIPKGYDIYLSEGEFFKLVILKSIGRLGRKSKIINLFSDPRLFYLDRKINYDLKGQKIRKSSAIKCFILEKLMSRLDGAVCVGRFEESLLKRHYMGPIERVDVFIEKNFHKKLLALNPKLIEKKVLFIGNGPDIYYKGVDLLIEVARENPNVKFTVVGGFFENFLAKNPIPKNVKFIGKVNMNSDRMSKIIGNNALYVHLGRGEAFGITVLEAMAAGLPCIVSELTGAKEAVGAVNPDLIAPLDKLKVTEKIRRYFEKNLVERKNLSERFKNKSKFYGEQKQLLNFRNRFEILMEEIYGRGS